jgi:hypothetical protein
MKIHGRVRLAPPLLTSMPLPIYHQGKTPLPPHHTHTSIQWIGGWVGCGATESFLTLPGITKLKKCILQCYTKCSVGKKTLTGM